MPTQTPASNSDARKRNAEKAAADQPPALPEPLDLDRLRKVAEAATPGPWDFEAEGLEECGEPAGCCSEYWDNRIWGEGIVLLESYMLRTEDARHIATFDPPTVLALLDRVAELEAKEARVESLRQAAEVVVLDAGDEATGPEPDPNLAELAHCVAALAGEPGRSEAEVKAAVLAAFVEYGDEAGSGIHSWRCAYPDRYGPCRCREEFAADVAARVAGGVPGRSEAEIKADAWDEGHAAGFCESRHPFNPNECAHHENPYRQEQGIADGAKS